MTPDRIAAMMRAAEVSEHADEHFKTARATLKKEPAKVQAKVARAVAPPLLIRPSSVTAPMMKAVVVPAAATTMTTSSLPKTPPRPPSCEEVTLPTGQQPSAVVVVEAPQQLPPVQQPIDPGRLYIQSLVRTNNAAPVTQPLPTPAPNPNPGPSPMAAVPFAAPPYAFPPVPPANRPSRLGVEIAVGVVAFFLVAGPALYALFAL